MAGKTPSRVALEHLRSWRAYREMTLEILAKTAGMTPASISKLENIQAHANPVTVFKLAKALGISRKQLLEEEPTEEWLKSPGQHEQTAEDKKEAGAPA
jgi:transcriptional regulator with XRE-family HTH domain